MIAVYAKISFANITGIGWGWAGVIWLYSLIFYVPLDVIKFVFNYALSGDAWNLVLDRKVGACLVLLLSPRLILDCFLKTKTIGFFCHVDSVYL